MMQLLFTAYLLLTFILKHRPYPQLNPERSPVLYLSATHLVHPGSTRMLHSIQATMHWHGIRKDVENM